MVSSARVVALVVRSRFESCLASIGLGDQCVWGKKLGC